MLGRTSILIICVPGVTPILNYARPPLALYSKLLEPPLVTVLWYFGKYQAMGSAR